MKALKVKSQSFVILFPIWTKMSLWHRALEKATSYIDHRNVVMSVPDIEYITQCPHTRCDHFGCCDDWWCLGNSNTWQWIRKLPASFYNGTYTVKYWNFTEFYYPSLRWLKYKRSRCRNVPAPKVLVCFHSLHQAALESLPGQRSERKSDCLLVVFFSLFKPNLLSAASSVGVESIMNRFSLIRHRGTCIFFIL